MRKKKIAIILQFVSHNRLNLNDADLILLTEGSLFAMLKAVVADIRGAFSSLEGTLALSSRSGMEPVS